MIDREPAEVTNLDRYGNAALPWSRPRDLLVSSTPNPDVTFFLGTVGSDGRPHAAGVGMAWLAGDLYFTRRSHSSSVGPLPTLVPAPVAATPRRARLRR